MPSLNTIQITRYSEILRLVLGIEGGSPAREIATELFPNLTLENDRPEWGVLGDTRFAFGRAAAINVVGPISINLSNAAGSDTLVVVTRGRGTLDNNTPGVGTLRWGIGAASNVTTDHGGQRFADTRVPPGTTTAQPDTRVQSFAGVNALAIKDEVLTEGNVFTNQEFRGPIILSPGFSAVVQHDLPNITLHASFEWYERTLPDRERIAGTG